jgi:predicted outer membrane repeat protein
MPGATVTDCKLYDNTATTFGGGIYSWGHSTFDGCTLARNAAPSGGGLYIVAEAEVDHCTLADNSASVAGGGIYCGAYELSIENRIIAFGSDGASVYCVEGVAPVLTCCDIYDNEGGDWEAPCIEDQLDSDGNISADPLFCYEAGGNFHIDDSSPCAPSYNPSCGLVGAWSVDPDCMSDIPEDPERAPVSQLLECYPSPFATNASILYHTLPQGSKSHGRLVIYDCAGRQVRCWTLSAAQSGTHLIGWDGTDDHGRPVGAGVYLLELSTERGNTGRRITVIR